MIPKSTEAKIREFRPPRGVRGAVGRWSPSPIKKTPSTPGASHWPKILHSETRLDAMCLRVFAQRTLIDDTVKLVANLPGPVLELGLGSGRTYDHLRHRFPEREIFVFDRELASHPDSRPDAWHFIPGDFRETLPRTLALIGAKAALAHCDIGSHDLQASRLLGATIAPLLAPIMLHASIVLSDQPLPHPDFRAMPLPDCLEPESYFMYRVR